LKTAQCSTGETPRAVRSAVSDMAVFDFLISRYVCGNRSTK